MTFLKWDNLISGYHSGEPLHKPFSGEIREPGLYAVLGQNGCGKSSLLKTWLQFLPALSGEIRILNHVPPKKNSTTHLPGVAFVPQYHRVNSFFHMATEDLVAQGLGPNPSPQGQEQLEEALARWQLTGLRKRSFHELSHGQKTRGLLGRAFLSRPKLLFLDEPLATLDTCCQKELMTYLQELIQTQDLCVVLCDHHLEGFDDFIKGRILFHRGHDEAVATLQVEINHKGENRP